MNNKIHEFSLKVYPFKLWICYNINPNALNDLFDADNFGMLEKGVGAMTYRANRVKPSPAGGILIRFNTKADMTAQIIAHESTHAALEIFDTIGAEIDVKNQEPLAYLVGFCAYCCEQVKRNIFDED